MRFTIRDLLWLMVVVGMACALWIEHRTVAAVRKHAQTLQVSLFLARMHYTDLGPRGKLYGIPKWELADTPIP